MKKCTGCNKVKSEGEFGAWKSGEVYKTCNECRAKRKGRNDTYKAQCAKLIQRDDTPVKGMPSDIEQQIRRVLIAFESAASKHWR